MHRNPWPQWWALSSCISETMANWFFVLRPAQTSILRNPRSSCSRSHWFIRCEVDSGSFEIDFWIPVLLSLGTLHFLPKSLSCHSSKAGPISLPSIQHQASFYILLINSNLVWVASNETLPQNFTVYWSLNKWIEQVGLHPGVIFWGKFPSLMITFQMRSSAAPSSVRHRIGIICPQSHPAKT